MAGAADMVSVYIRGALVQFSTPDHMRGRVNAVNMLFIGSSNELGEFRAGTAAHAQEPEKPFVPGVRLTTPEERDALRTAANGLVLRASQAALVASKGAGFTVGHPAERGVREAMLFLVWSCPTQVAQAAMCELACLDAEG